MMLIINIQLFGGRGIGSGRIYLNYGQQSKHMPGHSNYERSLETRSAIDIDPNRIQQYNARNNSLVRKRRISSCACAAKIPLASKMII